MVTEFIKGTGVNFTGIAGSGAGFEGASAFDAMVETDMTDVLMINIACMGVVLELCMWHSTGMAGGGCCWRGMELDDYDQLLELRWGVMQRL